MSSASSSVRAVTLKVEDLLQHVVAGRIRVPRFQRPLKWKREDNQLLFDSILRGYPVGSLLFWQKPAPAELMKFGTVSIDAAQRSDAWLVVDGQQRITALAGSLLEASSRAADFDFVVDPRTFEVKPRSKQRRSDVPLAVLANTEILIPYLHAHPHVDVGAASSVSKRLREYSLAAAILETEDEQFVRQVFKRANSSGKAMSQNDVFRALHSGQPAMRSFEDARAVGARLDFGELDDSALVRAFKYLAGNDPLEELEPKSKGLPGASFVRATEATVHFFKQVALVPAAHLMPYALPFGVLVAFFARHTTVSARNATLLSYWFWRGVAKHLFGGEFTSIRTFFKSVEGSEDEAVQSLLGTVAGPWQTPPVRTVSRLRDADGKVVRLAMINARPLDLRQGTLLDARSVEPIAIFSSVKHALARTVVNRIIHPKLPRSGLISALHRAPDNVWRSHLLGDRIFDDPGAFLESRAVALQQGVDDFVARMSGRFDTARPPLEHLLGERP